MIWENGESKMHQPSLTDQKECIITPSNHHGHEIKKTSGEWPWSMPDMMQQIPLQITTHGPNVNVGLFMDTTTVFITSR